MNKQLLARGAANVTRFQLHLRRNYAIAGIEDYVNSAAYKKEIKDARIRIFGYAFDNNMRSGHKLLKKPLIGERLVKWYPIPIRHLDERFQDPRIEPRMRKRELKKKQGKHKPWKGRKEAQAAAATKGKKK